METATSPFRLPSTRSPGGASPLSSRRRRATARRFPERSITSRSKAPTKRGRRETGALFLKRARMRILITAAAAGLAQRIAFVLAQDGHDIAFTYRPDGTPPDATLELVRKAGREGQAYPVEFLGDVAEVSAALRAALNDPVEVLVHAVGPMVVRRFERSTEDD